MVRTADPTKLAEQRHRIYVHADEVIEMQIVSTTPHSKSEFWTVMGQYIVLWCIIYDYDHADFEPFVREVESLDIAELPTAILLLNASTEHWVENELFHRTRPVLLPFCGGFPVTDITSIAEFENKARVVVDFARGIMPQWRKAKPG